MRAGWRPWKECVLVLQPAAKQGAMKVSFSCSCYFELQKSFILLSTGTNTSGADVWRWVSNRNLGWKEKNTRELTQGRFLSRLFILLGFGLGY